MLTKKTIRKPRQKEKTTAQSVSYSFPEGVLHRPYVRVGTYKQLREIRKDPTIILARALLISCVQSGSWNIETDEDVSDDVKEFIEHILPLRDDYIYNVVAFGKVDYGWMGFEKIFKVNKGRIEIEYLKPLLHDITNILVTKNGHFNGYRQQNIISAMAVDLFPEKCLHTAFDVEAGNFYGIPLLENIRKSCNDWVDCNEGAKRYDKKLAGTHWVIYYPPGLATIDGESVKNDVTAGKILDALQSSGSVAIPTTVIEVIQELNTKEAATVYAWKVELLEDSGTKQESFGARLKYLDSQKVRGLLMPERSLLEGQFGTKAEAGEHISLMLNNLESIDRQITRMTNEQLVNQLVLLNFGQEMVGRVRLVSAPLVDEQIGFLRELYKSKSDPNIDLSALKERLDIPEQEGGSVIQIPKKDDNDANENE